MLFLLAKHLATPTVKNTYIRFLAGQQQFRICVTESGIALGIVWLGRRRSIDSTQLSKLILLLPMEYGLYYYCNERSRTPMHDDAGSNRKQLTSILFVQQNQMKICNTETNHSTKEHHMWNAELRILLTVSTLNSIDKRAYLLKQQTRVCRKGHKNDMPCYDWGQCWILRKVIHQLWPPFHSHD